MSKILDCCRYPVQNAVRRLMRERFDAASSDRFCEDIEKPIRIDAGPFIEVLDSLITIACEGVTANPDRKTVHFAVNCPEPGRGYWQEANLLVRGQYLKFAALSLPAAIDGRQVVEMFAGVGTPGGAVMHDGERFKAEEWEPDGYSARIHFLFIEDGKSVRFLRRSLLFVRGTKAEGGKVESVSFCVTDTLKALKRHRGTQESYGVLISELEEYHNPNIPDQSLGAVLEAFAAMPYLLHASAGMGGKGWNRFGPWTGLFGLDLGDVAAPFLRADDAGRRGLVPFQRHVKIGERSGGQATFVGNGPGGVPGPAGLGGDLNGSFLTVDSPPCPEPSCGDMVVKMQYPADMLGGGIDECEVSLKVIQSGRCGMAVEHGVIDRLQDGRTIGQSMPDVGQFRWYNAVAAVRMVRDGVASEGLIPALGFIGFAEGRQMIFAYPELSGEQQAGLCQAFEMPLSVSGIELQDVVEAAMLSTLLVQTETVVEKLRPGEVGAEAGVVDLIGFRCRLAKQPTTYWERVSLWCQIPREEWRPGPGASPDVSASGQAVKLERIKSASSAKEIKALHSIVGAGQLTYETWYKFCIVENAEIYEVIDRSGSLELKRIDTGEPAGSIEIAINAGKFHEFATRRGIAPDKVSHWQGQLIRISTNVPSIMETYALSRVVGEGPKVFLPDAMQCEALEGMEMRFPAEMYEQPFPTLMLKFPTDFAKNRRAVSDFGEIWPVAGVIHHDSAKRVCIACVAMSSGEMAVRQFVTAGTQDLEYNALKSGVNVGMTEGEADVVGRMVRVLCNTAQLMAMSGHRKMGPIDPARKKWLESRKNAKTKPEILAANRAELKSVAEVVDFDQRLTLYIEEREPRREFPAEGGADTPPGEGGGRQVGPHWRSGHYIHYWVGKRGTEERRRVLRSRPAVFVNKHLFTGDAINARVNVRVVGRRPRRPGVPVESDSPGEEKGGGQSC